MKSLQICVYSAALADLRNIITLQKERELLRP